MPDRGFGAPGGRKWPSPIDLAHRPYNSVCTNVLHCDVKKTYQFKTHSKCDSHSSKTAHIILPGLVIKQRWTTLRLQAKWYSNSLNCALCWLKQLISPKLNSLPVLSLADLRSFTFVLSRVLAKWYLQFYSYDCRPYSEF